MGRRALLGLALALGAAAAARGAADGHAFACEVGAADCLQCEAGVDPGCNCTRDDFDVWITGAFFQFEEPLQECAFESALDLISREALLKCFAKDPVMQRFDTPCQGCFAETVACTVQKCNSCLNVKFKEDPVCRKCVQTICEPEFITCAGWTTLSCDEDLCERPPEPSIIPGLPDEAFFGIIGGVGIIIVLVVALLIRRSCRSMPEDVEEDKLKVIELTDTDTYQMPIKALTSNSPSASPHNSSSTLRSGKLSGQRTSVTSRQRFGSEAFLTPSPSIEGAFEYDLDSFPDKPDI